MRADLSDFIKRLFDLVVSLVLATLLLPLLALLAVLEHIDLGSPALFRQQRPGLWGKPFTFYKFRTMNNRTDVHGRLLSDDGRLTGFGRCLRRTSLDELPQLFNVIRGDMSLVGPRPLLMEYLDLYTDEQMRRHAVKPGITGWAQINGRNAITWEEKFSLDLWYVDNHSFFLDLRIILLTVVRIIKKEGISQKGMATAEKFKGSIS
ncbi:MAG: sugar transferase [Gammaproteobacteria bacterium]|nr:sugar transferase [Gammaproteobacteria bacterium]